MIPSVGSGLTTTPTRQPHNAKGGGAGGMALSACKPQRVPSSPAAAAAAEKKTKANNGDMTDSEALRRASQVSGVAALGCENALQARQWRGIFASHGF